MTDNIDLSLIGSNLGRKLDLGVVQGLIIHICLWLICV